MKRVNGLILVGVVSMLLAMGAGFALLHTPNAGSSGRAAPAVKESSRVADPTPSVLAEPRVETHPKSTPTGRGRVAPAGPAAPKTALPPAVFGYDEAPELALAAELGLTPEQAEAVGQVIRECDADLEGEMLELMRRGYDDVVAKQIGQRHEKRVLRRVEEVLPPEARPRFRALVARESRNPAPASPASVGSQNLRAPSKLPR